MRRIANAVKRSRPGCELTVTRGVFERFEAFDMQCVMDTLRQCPANCRNRAEQGDRIEEAESECRAALDAKPEEELRRAIRFRLATILQKREKFAESADIIQSLMASVGAERVYNYVYGMNGFAARIDGDTGRRIELRIGRQTAVTKSIFRGASANYS